MRGVAASDFYCRYRVAQNKQAKLIVKQKKYLHNFADPIEIRALVMNMTTP